MALIEIDGLPINSMVIFHGYVTNNQMVFSKYTFLWASTEFNLSFTAIFFPFRAADPWFDGSGTHSMNDHGPWLCIGYTYPRIQCSFYMVFVKNQNQESPTDLISTSPFTKSQSVKLRV